MTAKRWHGPSDCTCMMCWNEYAKLYTPSLCVTARVSWKRQVEERLAVAKFVADQGASSRTVASGILLPLMRLGRRTEELGYYRQHRTAEQQVVFNKRHRGYARAERILVDHLNADQRESYYRSMCFFVVGGSGTVYLIDGTSAVWNLYLYDPGPNVVARTCLNIGEQMNVPVPDNSLAQKLALETNEGVMVHANARSTLDCTRYPEWLRYHAKRRDIADCHCTSEHCALLNSPLRPTRWWDIALGLE